MHYHLILTELCNSNCKYCYEKSMQEFNNDLDKKFKFDFSAPPKSKIDIQKLKNFLDKDKDPTLIFYGGEPLLEIKKIKEIMDKIDVPFRMQTNGKLLNKLPIKYLKRIDKLLISIDGDEQRTDYNRGEGTYNQVLENIKKVKHQGYNGELIARMTITKESPDIYTQIKNLITAGFTSIHWQLDAGFYKFDFDKEKFKEFTVKYNKEISKLIDFWIEDMKKNKRVLKLYPLLAITRSLLNNETTKLRCGAGYAGYAITTDGKIVACPIMNSIVNFYAGDLNSKKLKQFDITGDCKTCNYLNFCGGRCLYWNHSNLWPKEGDDLICSTIKHLIDELRKANKEIKELIKNKTIKDYDFDYEKYFGPEIIP